MTEPVALAVVGCGRIAGTHLQALEGFRDARLVGVADVNEPAAVAAAESFGVRAYRDYRDLLEAEAPDAVVVCTPPATHPEISLHALARGVHVLCEKPFAVDWPNAVQMVAAASSAGRWITMASKFRFVHDMAEARRLIASGTLGTIGLFEVSFCARVDMRGRWNADPSVSGGGVLADNGAHAVDVVRYLFGPIARVHARHGPALAGLEVENTSIVLMETAGGALGHIDLSWGLDKDQDHYVRAFGTEGSLAVGWRRSWFQRNGHEPEPFGSGYDKLEAFRAQYQNFVGCIGGSAIPVIDATDSLASVRVIDCAYRSARTGGWVEVEP
jgi:predicted dehydrogenase